jgi:hypothetical protein
MHHSITVGRPSRVLSVELGARITGGRGVGAPLAHAARVAALRLGHCPSNPKALASAVQSYEIIAAYFGDPYLKESVTRLPSVPISSWV